MTKIQHGFSLPQILAAMGIAALLLSIGLPGMADFAKDARQVSTANDLLADLHFARDLAVRLNARVTVCPSSNGANCNGASWNDGRIVFVDTDADGAVSGEETVQRIASQTKNVDVATDQFATSITYRSNGRAMADVARNNTGEFVICDDRGSMHARALIVDTSGRPHISQDDANGRIPACPVS